MPSPPQFARDRVGYIAEGVISGGRRAFTGEHTYSKTYSTVLPASAHFSILHDDTPEREHATLPARSSGALPTPIDARVPAGTLLRDLIDAITHHYHRAWKLCSRPALSCPGRVCFRSCVIPSRRGRDPRELTAASRGGWRVLLGCERGRCAGRIYLRHADLRRHPHRREHECTRPSGQNTVHPLGGGGRGAA